MTMEAITRFLETWGGADLIVIDELRGSGSPGFGPVPPCGVPPGPCSKAGGYSSLVKDRTMAGWSGTPVSSGLL